MQQIINELKKWGTEGFTNHEDKAFLSGYIKKYFSEYLPAKKRLLEGRDVTTDRNTRKCLNAIRIYVYTLFENTWFGYLAAYSDEVESIFKVSTLDPLKFKNAYRNHLPSFSSVILNFGTCRDLFFILTKLYAHPALVNNPKGIKDLLNARYNSCRAFKKDLSVLSSDPSYLQEGEDFFNRNMFRNFFAHKIRLLWWNNKKCSEIDYFIDRYVYDAIQKKNHSRYLKYVEDVFEDQTSYQNKIATSNCTDLISANEMLKLTHDNISHFLNKSFGLLK